jgi:hypothetical protein
MRSLENIWKEKRPSNHGIGQNAKMIEGVYFVPSALQFSIVGVRLVTSKGVGGRYGMVP